MFLKGLFTIGTSSVLSTAVSLLLNQFQICHSYNWWVSLLVFAVIFFALNFLYNMKTNNRSYSEMLFGTIGGKAFVLMIVVFLYAILDKKGLFAFAMHFIAHYILFTVFEIRYLLLIIKKRETQKT